MLVSVVVEKSPSDYVNAFGVVAANVEDAALQRTEVANEVCNAVGEALNCSVVDNESKQCSIKLVLKWGLLYVNCQCH